jgi:nicotinate phosphoribosyltransferase
MMDANAPIDGFGVGTSLTTSSDAPALDCAYKLQEYAGIARRKRSVGKATWPGRKQVWRTFGADGRMTGDVLALQDDHQAGEPLLLPFMRHGKRLAAPPILADLRRSAAQGLAQLPESLRRLSDGTTFPVTIAPGLIALAEEVDRRCAAVP